MFRRRKRAPLVLVLESSKLVCKLLHLLLEREGAQVCFADSVAQAQQMLTLQSVDLVLAELGNNGSALTLLHAMHAQAALQAIPLAVLSTAKEREQCQLAVAMGARAVLSKPFEVHAVKQLLEDVGLHPQWQASNDAGIALGILCECDLHRHHLKQVLTGHGYRVAANLRPEQWLQTAPRKLTPVRLWLVDLRVNQEEDERWVQLISERLDAPMLFGLDRAPANSGSVNQLAFKQWERRLLNKVEQSLFGKIVSRDNPYHYCKSQGGGSSLAGF